MKQFSLAGYQNGHIHMIGIGGISMSALAEWLMSKGMILTGSDMKESEALDRLQSLGATVYAPHDAEKLNRPDLVVYTAAISESNPELVKAKGLGIPCIERSILLGAIMGAHQQSAAISGTHGKTTTTSMVASVLLDAGMNPTVHVGGLLDRIGGNLRIGSTDLFITEACEYKDSFLDFFPTHAIVLNVEADHLDWFKDLAHVERSFLSFLSNVPDSGQIVLNMDDAGCRDIAGRLGRNYTKVSLNDARADVHAAYLTLIDGCAAMTVVIEGHPWSEVRLAVPGIHNASNALCAAALCYRLGVTGDDFAKGIAAFHGTHRRFERKGTVNGALVVDDYAHHPTEIRATLKAARAYNKERIICVFQPHTYTRTHELFGDFSQAFADCDEVIVTDIYAAREPDTGLVHAAQLADGINAVSGNAIYVADFLGIASALQKTAQEGDLIITMGAGDVYKIADMLIQSNPK